MIQIGIVFILDIIRILLTVSHYIMARVIANALLRLKMLYPIFHYRKQEIRPQILTDSDMLTQLHTHTERMNLI